MARRIPHVWRPTFALDTAVILGENDRIIVWILANHMKVE